MNRRSSFPISAVTARRGLSVAKLTTLTLLGQVLTSQSFAAGGTIGGRMQAGSADLTTGIGYVLEMFGYMLGGAAALVCFQTLWSYSKNQNGQAKLSHAAISGLVAGAFLSVSLWGSFASNTISGSNVTNSGTAQQLTFP